MYYECCEIRVFIKKDWEDLFGIVNVLQVVSDQFFGRYGIIIVGNDRSREEEDKCMQGDLNYIYVN